MTRCDWPSAMIGSVRLLVAVLCLQHAVTGFVPRSVSVSMQRSHVCKFAAFCNTL